MEDDAGGEAGDPMSAAVLEPTNLTERIEERDRRARVASALRNGQRPASVDTRPSEFFAQVPVADLLALSQARRLSGAELRFVLAVVARTYRTCCYATQDLGSDKPPRLADWAQWLGLCTVQQVHNVRASLHAKGVLTYVDGDARKLAFNPRWESWDASVFSHQEARTGSGRPRKPHPDTKLASLLADTPATNSTHKFSENTLASLVSSGKDSTCKFTHKARQPRQGAAADVVAIDSISKRDKNQIDANASSAAEPTRVTPPGQPVQTGLPIDPETMGNPEHRAGAKTRPAAHSTRRARSRTPQDPKPPRELSAKDQYRVDVLAAVEVAREGEKAPNHGREWGGAGTLYDRGFTRDEVLACYRLEMQRPKWDAEYLSLTDLIGKVGAYRRSPEGYAASVARSRDAANGFEERDAQRAAGAARGGNNGASGGLGAAGAGNGGNTIGAGSGANAAAGSYTLEQRRAVWEQTKRKRELLAGLAGGETPSTPS